MASRYRAADRRGRSYLGKVWDAIRGKAAIDPYVWQSGTFNLMGQPQMPWQSASTLWREFTVQEKERVMQSCNTVYACVWAIMQATTKAPLTLGIEDAKGEWKKTPKHPLLALLKTPNPCLSWPAILQRLTAHLEVAGRCHLWKWRNKMNDPAELWPMPPSWVTAIGPDGIGTDPTKRLVDHYDIQIPGGACYKNIQPKDLTTVQYGDPFSLTGCLPPLHAAMKDVQLATRQDDYEIERLANLKPTPVVTSKEAISQAQRDDLRAVVRERMGYDNSVTAIVMGAEAAKVEILDAMAGFDWKRFRDLREADICAAFRVPPVVAGVVVGLENSPWSNMGEAKTWFFDGKIVPLWKMLEDGLTLGLLRHEGEAIPELWFDPSEVKELSENQDAIALRMKDGWVAGAVTRNEYRQALNLKADTARGDVYLIGMGVSEENANEKPVPPEPIAPPNPADHAAGAGMDMAGGDMGQEGDMAGGEKPPKKSIHPHKPRSQVSGQFNHPGSEHPATVKVPIMPAPEVVMPCEDGEEDDEDSGVSKEFDPDQPRDENGRWGEGGSVDGSGGEEIKIGAKMNGWKPNGTAAPDGTKCTFTPEHGGNLFHGTHMNDDSKYVIPDKDGVVYLTDDYDEAVGYANGGHLGGMGSGTPRVIEQNLASGDMYDVQDAVDAQVEKGEDLGPVFDAARKAGASYAYYLHPSFSGESDQKVIVALNPGDQLGKANRGWNAANGRRWRQT
jgi:phage portal protein BeeE